MTLGINNPEGFKKLRYAVQRSWNGHQSSSWEKLLCIKIALNRRIRTEIRLYEQI